MSQFDQYNDDEDDDDDRAVNLSRKDIRALEASAKKGRRAEALERENAFLKAGIDVESPVGQMFARGYDGDLTTAAIKASAETIPGALKGGSAPTDEAKEQTPEETADEEEKSATAERSALANGSKPDDGKAEDPRLTALQRSQEAMKRGATEEDALGSFFNTVATAANQGDKRVVVS